jgi:SAM-dependent methyltransferase
MNQETRKLLNDIEPEKLQVLEISGRFWSQQIKFGSYQTFDYPKFDICKDVLEQQFDLVLAEQVFEHLQSPHQAARNVYQMLREGGYFLITTPFLIRVHNVPIDCTRWTEQGLKNFLSECGFDQTRIQSNSWGNRACVKANFSKWINYRPHLHSLKNEPDFPVVVWALAQK